MKALDSSLSFSDQFEDLLKQFQSYNSSSKDLKNIRKAYEFSNKAHISQFRRTGEPYIHHPIAVAYILSSFHLDAPSIITGLLHDVVEDTEFSKEDIKKEFGDEVEGLVDGMTKISKIKFKNEYQKESENVRKMVVYMGKDVRVILVKLADRLHNMRTLDVLPQERQVKISQETLSIYAPLAGRLGLNSIKTELEDLSFRYSYPEVFSTIFQKYEDEQAGREKYIQHVIQFLTHDLSEKMKTKFIISGRTKNVYSIYRKMQTQNLNYDEVFDIIAFRVCTEKISECYEILGWVHALWKPIPLRFKDFIAIPKNNHYQSLHTTVIGPEGKRIEIQIRTHDMHVLAESGVATHWKYKEESALKNATIQQDSLKKFSWLKDLVDLHRQSNHSSEFLESIKSDLFESDICVFTPKGEVKEFTTGATPIDFAYHVHTDLGDHLKEAKVNGRIVSIKHKLQNGDMIEIATSNKCHPKRDWLNHCVTSKARSKIKHFINEEERMLSIELGSKVLEKLLKKEKINTEVFFNKSECQVFMKSMGFNTPEDVYYNIGLGKIVGKEFITKVLGEKIVDKIPIFRFKKKKKKKDESLIEVDGLDSIMVNLAQCCSPLPGENIVGYISMDRGVMIHRYECSKLLSMNSERFVDANWKVMNNEVKHNVLIQILAYDSSMILKKIVDVFAELDINMLDVKAESKNNEAQFVIKIEVKDISHLDSTLKSLEKVPDIFKVSRLDRTSIKG